MSKCRIYSFTYLSNLSRYIFARIGLTLSLIHICNVRRALYLADGSAIAYYQSLAEKGYFNRIIASNVSQNVVVDSIRCDFDCYPYAVETFARQKIVRESNVTERTLVTTCRLRNAVRSDNNPQGFLIEDLRILENKDLGSYER